MSPYQVVFYCPDTNLVYNGNTPDQQGIGGSKTALIRLARSLANSGHHVTCFVNCDQPGIYSRVEYRHFEEADHIRGDVLIAASTGGDLSLRPLLRIPVEARLKTVFVHGIPKPEGLDELPYDRIYVPSYFMKEVVVRDWGVPAEKTFLCYNGVEENNFQEAEGLNIPRDPFAIVYHGHPAKGMDVAVEIVRTLRRRDERFHLDIYGGYELYGESRLSVPEEEGIVFKGLVGQKELAGNLFSYGFCLALQEYQEPFGIAVIEAKRAGVIVIASKVGAYAETISDGYDGFLIEEHYRSRECREKVIRLVEYMVHNEGYGDYIGRNAKRNSFSWEKTARDLTIHWDGLLGGERNGGKRFVVAGWYGAGNLGDEAVLTCTIDAIRETGLDTEITAVSVNPSYTEKRHKCRAVDRGNVGDMDKAVRESDVVMLGGGGLFQDYQQIVPAMLLENPCSGVTSFAAVPLLAKIYGKPLFYYAQGVGPLFSEESMLFTKFAYELADLVTVRDKPSYDLLRFIGVDEKKFHLTADPAINIKLLSDERINYMFLCEDIPRDKRLISVIVRFWLEKYKEEKIVTAVAEAMNTFLTNELEYCFVMIPFSPTDTDINRRIIDLVDDKSKIHILKKEYSPEEITTFMSKSAAVIGMRFHSCVFAAIGHVPFIALNYDYKVETFAREMGMAEFILEPADLDAGQVLQKLKLLLAKREELSCTIRDKLSAMTLKEKINRSLMRNFMEENVKAEKKTGGVPFRDAYTAVLQKQIASLNKELTCREEEIKHLRKEIARKNNQMLSLSSEIENRDRQLADYGLKLETAEGKLSTLLNTKIWKIGQLYDKLYGRTLLGKATNNILNTTIFMKRRK